jgi:S1-C subfamily serine protease
MRTTNFLVRRARISVFTLLSFLGTGCGWQVYLGVNVEDAKPEARTAVQIQSFDPCFPHDPNLHVSDVILGLDTYVVTTMAGLQQQLAKKDLDQVLADPYVNLGVFRPTGPKTGTALWVSAALANDPNSVPTSLGLSLTKTRTPTSGVTVVSVVPGSVGDAGFDGGEIITKFGSIATTTTTLFRSALAATPVGSNVTLTFVRVPTDPNQFDPTKDTYTTAVTIDSTVVGSIPVLGIQNMSNLPSNWGASLGYSVSGARVRATMLESPAFLAATEPNYLGAPGEGLGIMPYDVIVEFQGVPVTSASQFGDLVRATGGTGTVNITYHRAGLTIPVTATLSGLLNFSGLPYTADTGMTLLPDNTAGGVRVLQVATGTPGGTAGINANDLITQVQFQSVNNSVQDFYRDIHILLADPNYQGQVTLTRQSPTGGYDYPVLQFSTSPNSPNS